MDVLHQRLERRENPLPPATPKRKLWSVLRGTNSIDMSSLSRNRCLLKLIIGERIIDMNKQLKNLMSVVITILLLAACGQLETAPAPADVAELIVTESPTSVSTVVVANESDPEIFSKYIGLNYPPLPAGLSDSFSMIIQDSDDHSLWLVLDGENKMLWLSKLTHRDSSGNAYLEVKDILDLSNVEVGLTLIPDGCLLNGVPESEIFVAGRNGVMVLAWRANTSLDRFEIIATDGIECHSDKGVNLE